jgi:hypothetical protein
VTGPASTPPSGKPPLAVGGTSVDGTTTVVPLSKPKLDYSDKKVLCSAMCQCQTQPNIGADGRRLKQECVSGRLKSLDAAMLHTSPYKAEYTYDMTKRPPMPFLDKEVPTKAKNLFPGWTTILWPKDPTRPQPYKAGQGYTRRPDVVIVKDPSKPPTQDNIKQVVEMKFPDDTFGRGQRQDYITIAGGSEKMVPLELSDCDCNQKDPDPPKIPVEQLGKAATILGIIYMAVMKRPPPGGVPAY